MDMDLQPPEVSLFDLYLFVQASRQKSLRELSRQLDLQPAHVSKALRRLETKLGLTLFRRTTTGIVLSKEGKDLIPIAEEICLNSEILTQRAHGLVRSVETVFGIGSMSFLCQRYLSSCIELLSKEKYPDRFRLVEFTHNQLVSHGLDGAFEATVHIGKLSWTNLWESHEVGRMTWNLYARADHPLHDVATEEEVLQFPFIVPTDWTQNGFVTGGDFCPASWYRRRRGHEAATAETALEIVKSTQNLTFVPDLVARQGLAAGRIKLVRVKGWARVDQMIYLTIRIDKVPKPFFKRMLQVLQAELHRKQLDALVE